MGVLETLGWALSVFTILALGKRAVDKLIGTEEMIKYLSSINLEKYRVIVGQQMGWKVTSLWYRTTII